MAEQKIKWTDQQKRAIVARGSDVLVTASAGTGKTAVLSGRCVDIIADKSICPDVWRILVLTFTDMAAEQMRSRIAEQLRTAYAQTGDQHLQHQLMLLQGADISTIHSFCKRIITEYFYKLGLDPTFSVIDADEARLLKAEVLDATIEWAWQQSDLEQTLEQLLYRRDLRTNDGFLAKIIELSDFLDGVLFRENWYERASRLAEAANPFTSDLGEKQKQIVADRLQHILTQIQYAVWLYESENPGGRWATKWQETFVEPVAEYIKLLKSGDWDKFSKEIRNYQKLPRFEYKPKELSGPIAEIIRGITKGAKKSFDKLFDLAILNPQYLDKVSRAVSLQTMVLIKLVKKFDRLYSQAKRAVNCLDFADLEHYALKLLTDEGSCEDNLVPSQTALTLRRKYKYIFVDEFQDINPVQQAILDAISSGGNVLEVGDVKQSIYAFRGAEPEIFLKQLKQASVDPKKVSKSLRVDLNINFRSAKGILDFVNKIFSRIMRGCRFAGLDYDQSAQLRPAVVRESQSPDREGGVRDRKNVVEFHILDQADRQGEGLESEGDEHLGLVSSRQRQAAMIAQRIKQIVGAETGKPEFQIYDKQQNTFRDVQYRDIVILMRSLSKKANDYVEVLRLAGVPVSCQATAGYFETTEITDMLCLLKVLGNPQRDIELAAVLRSPFFKISDTELTKIKIHSDAGQQNKNYYDCMLQYSRSGPDGQLADKLKKILRQIEQWRTAARRGSLADLLWQIYRQTGFLSFVSAQPAGQARKANLLKLHDRAIQFEGFATSAAIPSLSRFVEFIEKLQEVGQDWAPAEPESVAGNAVRILSVHKSKGLEFPVVFLAELESQFNKKDIYADILADASDTLGLQIIDRKSNSRLRSLAHEVIAEQKLTKTLAEEMRILYVATTRARDRLILTASQKRNHCRGIITNGFYSLCVARDAYGVKANAQYTIRDTQYAIREWQLRACQSPLEWVLYALCDQKALHEAFETELAVQSPDHEGGVRDDHLFSLKL
ncbi:MAG: UvrD-helicase domain-containing protein, partial [Sedimentisphaerales bacterium]